MLNISVCMNLPEKMRRNVSLEFLFVSIYISDFEHKVKGKTDVSPNIPIPFIFGGY